MQQPPPKTRIAIVRLSSGAVLLPDKPAQLNEDGVTIHDVEFSHIAESGDYIMVAICPFGSVMRVSANDSVTSEAGGIRFDLSTVDGDEIDANTSLKPNIQVQSGLTDCITEILKRYLGKPEPVPDSQRCELDSLLAAAEWVQANCLPTDEMRTMIEELREEIKKHE